MSYDYSHYDGYLENAEEIGDVPLGTYECVAKILTHGKTKSGVPRISLALEVTEGMYEGSTIWKNWILSEKAAPYNRAEWRTLGADVVRGTNEVVRYLESMCGEFFTVKKSANKNTDMPPNVTFLQSKQNVTKNEELIYSPNTDIDDPPPF